MILSYGMKLRLNNIFLLTLVCICCSSENKTPIGPVDNEENLAFHVEVQKWYGGHKAAVSITYDALWGHWRTDKKIKNTVNAVLNRNLHIDFEMVTARYDNPEYKFIVTEIREEIIPKGIHFFGHGHEHVYHDSLSFESAYKSFKMCYDLMDQWGLEPRAYGYPHNSGIKNKHAGR